MSEEREDEEVATSQSLVEDENHKVRPPSRKKYEAEVEKLVKQIREKEEALEKMKTTGGVNINNELKSLKAEKNVAITKRKQIDTELEKIKKVLPEKMRLLGQLESSLIYKNEEKINTAIQRLEWNLKVQPFKLNEEKKIVSEIDRLKRSKKTLVQYLALKQEIAGIRDAQRCMREERDTYFHAVGKLNSDEERLRRNSTSTRTAILLLKQQIDELYESKRQLVANNKKQMEEYQGGREKQRKETWKRREDYRKAAIADRRKQQAELEMEKIPYEKHISWCNSLIKVLSRHNSLAIQEHVPDSLSPASSTEDPEPAEEIDDGQYVLLKKNDEGLDHSLGTKRPSKKNRRPRKQSSIKRVTLSSDMVQQLTELGLKAPNSVSEVAEAIENLRLKKTILEQDQQASEVASDAGISATESLICEMSRQASKTESCEEILETNPGEQVYTEILRRSRMEQGDNHENWEAEGGAVGGHEVQAEVLSPNSDSTVEGDAGSNESQSSFGENAESSGHDLRVLRRYSIDKEVKSDAVSESSRARGVMKVRGKNRRGLPTEKSLSASSDLLNPAVDRSMENIVYRSKPEMEGPSEITNRSVSNEKPTFLCLPSALDQESQQVLALTSPVDFPCLRPACNSSGNLASDVGRRSICNFSADAVKSGHHVNKASSPTVPHLTLAARLSNPSAATVAQQALFPAVQQPQPVLVIDNEEFPSLSQSMSQSWKGSNLSMRSSSGSSVHLEQQLQSCIRHLSSLTASQVTHQPHAQSVFPPHSGNQPPNIHVSEELPDSQQVLQKSGPPSCSNSLISMSHLPAMDKSSTEKWVESSVAFVKEFSPINCEDSSTASVTESTKL